MSNLVKAALWLRERPNGVGTTVETPTAMCKAAGFKDLRALGVALGGKSVQTLINWHRDQPRLFAAVVVGAAVLRD